MDIVTEVRKARVGLIRKLKELGEVKPGSEGFKKVTIEIGRLRQKLEELTGDGPRRRGGRA